MNMAKTINISETKFKLQIPNDWNYEEEDGIMSVYDPEKGLGALQFSKITLSPDELIPLSTSLKEILNIEIENSEILSQPNFVYCDFFDEDSFFWKYWIIKNEENALLISYNCEKEDAGKEDEKIEKIIVSILENQ